MLQKVLLLWAARSGPEAADLAPGEPPPGLVPIDPADPDGPIPLPPLPGEEAAGPSRGGPSRR
jgi:hypothetical protein